MKLFEARWRSATVFIAGLAAAWVALLLYLFSMAPGVTWAHQGADGGELLAAAVVNGVPHPPGYPIYVMVLRHWLAFIGWAAPATDLAWRGNLLSACFGAASVFVTVLVAAHLLKEDPLRWLWGLLAGLAWMASPLLWSQSILTEVYSLHALLIALLGWAVLAKPLRLRYTAAAVALGVAHHLTLLLLLPAALYALITSHRGARRWLGPLLALGIGGVIGALFYIRIPLAAAVGPPPINWGYADNWEGFLWLVTGAAYRGYLVGASLGAVLQRVTTWAYVVTEQFTPVGLALGFVGLAVWDRVAPALRTFSLLWIAPVSVYAILYQTRDSEIYLLPVAWLLSVAMTVGFKSVVEWLAMRFPLRISYVAGLFAALSIALLVSTRWETIALRNDAEARTYLAQIGAELEPESILVTLNDRETFAVWYGVWGDGSLVDAAPGLIPVNESLYQFAWYQRLQRDLYPDLPGIDVSVPYLVEMYAGRRPIYFADAPTWLDSSRLQRAGPLWRLNE
ncbi:protein O-mannosyl-transferase family [Caldilinea sp.]|uniref:protein O-mannosyl-transferase family n=1 Tax=Caldilinea sp. TaxID=2293560 RepID=UPI002604B3D0|nr:DUF2723 domain-containing protein [uncultured Caldilinea sp.]